MKVLMLGETEQAQEIISRLGWSQCTEWSLQGPRQVQDWDLIIYRPLPMHALQQSLPSLRTSLPDIPVLTLCDDEQQVLTALQAGSDEALQLQNMTETSLRHFSLRLRARQAAQQGQNKREEAAQQLHQGILRRLAGVLAHEINNPLGALLSFVDMLDDMQADSKSGSISAQDLDFLREMSPMIRQAADRIHQIALDSQQIAENLADDVQVHDLKHVLSSSVAMTAGHQAAAICIADQDQPGPALHNVIAPAGLSYSLMALFDQSLAAIGRDASAKIELQHRVIDAQMHIELRAQSGQRETLNQLELLWHQLRGDSAGSAQIESLRRQFAALGIELRLQRRAAELLLRMQFKVQRNPHDGQLQRKTPRQATLDVELAA